MGYYATSHVKDGGELTISPDRFIHVINHLDRAGHTVELPADPKEHGDYMIELLSDAGWDHCYVDDDGSVLVGCFDSKVHSETEDYVHAIAAGLAPDAEPLDEVWIGEDYDMWGWRYHNGEAKGYQVRLELVES